MIQNRESLIKPPILNLLSDLREEQGSPTLLNHSPKGLLKSRVSLTSTVDSPLLIRDKLLEEQDEEENKICSQFHHESTCLNGLECSHSHQNSSLKSSASFMLHNYPEMVTSKFGRRTRSFLV